MTETPDSNSGRDERGRFALGNPGGPGGPRRRAFVLRRAAEEAASPEHIAALIRKGIRLGLEGNVAAMRLVFERTSGRTAEVPLEAEPLSIVLPRLRTAADCGIATDKVLQAICEGAVDRETAKVLLDGIQARLKAIEVTEMEERIAELEKVAQAVELPGRSRR